jgi:hypothetical protein
LSARRRDPLHGLLAGTRLLLGRECGDPAQPETDHEHDRERSRRTRCVVDAHQIFLHSPRFVLTQHGALRYFDGWKKEAGALSRVMRRSLPAEGYRTMHARTRRTAGHACKLFRINELMRRLYSVR